MAKTIRRYRPIKNLRSQLSVKSRRLSTFNIASHGKQKFTEQEKKVLASFSSVNYAPTDSDLYQDWLAKHPHKLGWDRWLMMVIIGVAIGLTAVLMRQCLDALDKIKWDRTREFARQGRLAETWGWTAGISVVFVIFGSAMVAFIHPPAGGTGVPEIIAFLNGIVVHGTLSLKNFVVKFVANVLAVSAGLPCAIQGPVIVLGAVIAAGVGQFRSKTLNIHPKMFSRFRNPEDRRNFTSAGVAAGVAAAFNAPIGGLMFAMEDISSFWSRRLSWHTFLCCGIAAATANLFNTAFTGFQYQGTFGLFGKWMIEPLRLNVAIFLPCIVIGLIGGVFGAIFTRLNVAIQKLRRWVIGKVPGDKPKKTVRVLEVVFVTILMATVSVTLPMGFSCTEHVSRNDSRDVSNIIRQCGLTMSNFTLQEYNCQASGNKTAYSESATLLVGSGQAMLSKLVSRNTHYWFNYPSILSIFVIYFFLTCWLAGSAISGGIFVPTLVSGALYGRAIGIACLKIYASSTGKDYPDDHWRWIDPGALAMIGAGSLLGGVTRLTLAVTVIIVEMAQDIDMILPVMVANFVAKLVADMLSRPLYKHLLDIKSLPFLDPEPVVVLNDEELNLDLYKARDVMKSPVLTIHSVETVAHLARMLKDTDHGGFPVVKYDEETRSELCFGLITRLELLVILQTDEIYNSVDTKGPPISPTVLYEDISVDYIADPSAAMERVKMFAKFEQYNKIYVDLEQFINQSATKIDQHFSLHRTYLLFRTLGLRHLMVTDSRNRCVGMITRKDLLAFQIAERLLEKENDDAFEVSLENTRRTSDTVLPAITVLTPVGEEDEHHHTPKVNRKLQNNNNNSSLVTTDNKIIPPRSSTNL